VVQIYGAWRPDVAQNDVVGAIPVHVRNGG
jgi:hypothetical protein